ncbi:MAG: hypothetical protein GW928_06735 [Rhodoferax sp.]|nr:hypothetical protein [Rhodoferax sp.]
MRFVVFEGGGEAITALQGGHVQVYSGDASEAQEQMKAGAKIRVLAVMSPIRLDGKLVAVPTMKEQGYDVQWPIIRGFYMGPQGERCRLCRLERHLQENDGHPSLRQAARRTWPVQICHDRQGTRWLH